MKNLFNYSFIFILLSVSVVLNTGCKKLFGLERQKDWDFTPHVLDPNINKSAWQYLKERSIMKQPDTIFKRMYDAIMYSGIDTNLYTQSGHTFILLHNDAILRRSGTSITTDCYWGYYKVGSPAKAASAWTDYTPDQVKNWLLYLIAKGDKTFENLGPNNDTLTTLLPANTDPKNPASIMLFRIVNDRDSKLRINDFIGSKRSTQARTAGILSTNGPIHVVDRIVEYNQ